MTSGCVNGIYTQVSDADSSSQNVRYTQLAGSTIKYSVSSVNAKTTGSTKIITIPSGLGSFYPTSVRIVATAANTVIVPAIVQVGTNSSTYNNILAATTLTALTAVNLYQNYPLIVALTKVDAGTDIYVNVTTGATATTLTLTVSIIGDFL